jgi:circadian clock protein KaiB
MARARSRTNGQRRTKRDREAPRGAAAHGYLLCLYVTGSTPRSLRAIENIKRICEEHLAGRYDLQVYDLYQQPALAAGESIVAAPTLVKKLPGPLRRLVGDMGDEKRVLFGLDLRSRP